MEKGKSRRVNGGKSVELAVPLLEGARRDSLMVLWRVVPWWVDSLTSIEREWRDAGLSEPGILPRFRMFARR